MTHRRVAALRTAAGFRAYRAAADAPLRSFPHNQLPSLRRGVAVEMNYVDCYFVPVPRGNRDAYEDLARISAKVLMECGALRVVECWLDESGPEASSYHSQEVRMESAEYRSFAAAAGAGDDETVVMSFVEWPDKDTRDAGMRKFTSDPRMAFTDLTPVFDGARLVAAGFKPMLDEARET